MTTFREGGYGAAEATVELRPYTIVSLDANRKAVQADGTTTIEGVVETGAKVGATVAYALVNGQGTFKVRVGAAVRANRLITSDANGLAVEATTGNQAFGRSVASGAAGDVIEYVKTDKTA